MLFFYALSVGGFIECVFLFSPSAFIHDIFLKFPFTALSSFLGMHFKPSLKILVTTLNEGYKHINK
jgi:hypothetical protein